MKVGISILVRLSKDGAFKRLSIDKLYNQVFGEHIKDLEGEVWKDIKDYEGLYQVSTYGRVKSYCSGEKILKSGDNGLGYQFVHLCKNGKNKRYYVHRLVAETFIFNDDIDNKTVINHKDENPYNNHVENLEWCTMEYNWNYGTCKQRRVETNVKNGTYEKIAKKKGRKCRCIELDLMFNSIAEASRYFKCNSENIGACLRGRTNTACGYHWEYIDE
ncbi:MAG: HNH endonuclease [Clostridia bacterium]|nr:HNH endonuclease [Clostridia bacterium]